MSENKKTGVIPASRMEWKIIERRLDGRTECRLQHVVTEQVFGSCLLPNDEAEVVIGNWNSRITGHQSKDESRQGDDIKRLIREGLIQRHGAELGITDVISWLLETESIKPEATENVLEAYTSAKMWGATSRLHHGICDDNLKMFPPFPFNKSDHYELEIREIKRLGGLARSLDASCDVRQQHEGENGGDDSETLKWIRDHGGKVTARELMRGPRRFRNNPILANETLERLAGDGHGSFGYNRIQGNSGRPTKTFSMNESVRHHDAG